MNLGLGLGLTNYLRVPTVAINPDDLIAALFENGEEGAWYDPSDLTTLYQDSDGRTPAGVGDPVGLILDKSKGLRLGAELVTNGTFTVDEADTSNWDTSTFASTGESVGGVFRVTASAANGRQQSNVSLVSGKTYLLTGQARRVSGTGTALIGISNSGGGTFVAFPTTSSTSFVELRQIFTPNFTGGTVVAGASASGTGVYEFDNISIKELPGNHAKQATSTARPTLQLSGSSYYLDFDGVDDAMTATFAAAVGQPNTFAMAALMDATTTSYYLDGPAGSSDRHIWFANGSATTISINAGSTIQYDSSARTGNEAVYTSLFNGSSSYFRKDGSDLSVLSGTTVGANNWGGLTLASRNSGLSKANINIYGFIGVNRTLDPDEITTVENYLATKTGAFVAPEITGVPTHAGSAYVSDELVASPASVAATPASTTSWQWLRDGLAISGATSNTYTVVEADIGAEISVRQIERNLMGVDTATSVPTSPVAAFDPIALFAAAEEGAWYDPSDLTTLYQDSAGTTPVTGTGQPVGLMLDKSKGLTLGSELVTNGTFDDATGWSLGAGFTVLAGTLNYSGGYNRAAYSVGANAFEAGKTYKVTLTVSNFSSGRFTAFLSLPANPKVATASIVPTADGAFEAVLSPSANVSDFGIEGNAATASLSIDNISIRELPGNHAKQSTSTARPTLQLSGSSHYLDFDGVDDYLQTAPFSANQSQPNSLAAAFKFTTLARTEFVLDGIGAYRNTIYKVSGPVQAYAGTALVSTAPGDLAEQVAFAEFNTTTSFIRNNGVLQITGNTGSLQWGGITLGTAPSATGNFLDGRIYGAIGVNRSLTAAQITELETYLAEKTGFFAPSITGIPTITVS